MAKHRITMQFTLEVTDDAAARALAQQWMTDMSLHTIADGGRLVGSTDATLDNQRAVTSIVAMQVVARGAENLPWALVGDVEVSNESM
jgi:hypothetical protein